MKLPKGINPGCMSDISACSVLLRTCVQGTLNPTPSALHIFASSLHHLLGLLGLLVGSFEIGRIIRLNVFISLHALTLLSGTFSAQQRCTLACGVLKLGNLDKVVVDY
jgi:hypothetical protein